MGGSVSNILLNLLRVAKRERISLDDGVEWLLFSI